MIQKSHFYAVVVVYNTSISESKTCQRLRTITGHDIQVIVVDNSTKLNNNAFQSEKIGWKYMKMNGNVGLSKAYNAVLDFLTGLQGFVIWFDDDTAVTQEYFDALKQEISFDKHAAIFAPVIQGQDGKYWSPNRFRFLRNKQLKDMNELIDDSEFNAINSCTAVNLQVYSDYRYNEKLFLDQVDHNFFEDQRRIGRHFVKLPVVIHHSFSTKSRLDSVEMIKPRYRVMIPDFLNYMDKSLGRRALAILKVCGWGAREGSRYRSITFPFWCVMEIFRWYRKKRNIEER